ncbi:MAG: septation protein A [Myxococcales bacterium]|nr:septation protein A [Myxococcales bacterium]
MTDGDDAKNRAAPEAGAPERALRGVTAEDAPAPEAGAPKWLTDFGPLVVFAVFYKWRGIYWATGSLMLAAPLALALAYARNKKLETMPLVTAIIVLVFGGLTIALGDPRFIYIKPTLVSGLSGLTLLGGVAMKRGFMKSLFGSALELSDDGWRKLSLRFGLLLLALAATNECVWRTFTPARESVWIYFKLLGIPGLTMLFFVTQLPLIKRHAITKPDAVTKRDAITKPDERASAEPKATDKS